ncbi:MAG TPA: gephyrin-like molybdotransferase Glp [Kofleriaceae bacterium]|jgi:molybdopterin molybdotransferase
MHSVADAAAAVAARIERLGVERVPLREARGRILGEPIVAMRALPGFANSAMDGYAVRAADLPATLPIHAVVAAGDAPAAAIPERVAVRIFTGAPIPAGLDTIVIQEDATVADDRVTLPAVPRGDNVRPVGEDVALGVQAIDRGAKLGAGELGLLAALGVAEVPCTRQPRVAIIATGDELVDVASQLRAGQIVDSSAHMLAAAIRDAGGVPSYAGIAKDDPATLAELISRALDHDAVITTGGVSVGDRDHVHAALAAAGVQLALYKVAMRPGKPFSFATRGRVPIFGLPGNPVSTFVAFELFVRPALLAMQGATVTARPRVPVHLAGGYRKPAGRAHYLRATALRDGERLLARAHPKQGSAMLSGLVGCNALVEVAADVELVAPDAVLPALLLEAV